MSVKDVARTASGIFTGSVAKDLFEAEKQACSLPGKLVLKAGASVAAAASFHILKEDVAEVLEIASGTVKGLKD